MLRGGRRESVLRALEGNWVSRMPLELWLEKKDLM